MQRTTPSIQDSWPDEAAFCWGCGQRNEHGLKLRSYWDDDQAVATWSPKEHHLAFPGILNGGIISTIIDCHGTGTANAYHHQKDGSSDHDLHVTSRLDIRFIRPTPLDRPVTLRAYVRETDGRKTVVDCELYSEDTKCVVGEVTTIRVGKSDFLG